MAPQRSPSHFRKHVASIPRGEFRIGGLTWTLAAGPRPGKVILRGQVLPVNPANKTEEEHLIRQWASAYGRSGGKG